jgi:acyl-CoA dehydrogenase
VTFSWYLTDERRELQERARRFALDEVLPLANELDPRKEDIPRAFLDRMGEMGWFGITLPREVGGLGLGVFEYCLVAEELARAWMSVASIIARAQGMGTQVGDAARRRELAYRSARGQWIGAAALSEPGAGSDLANVQCRATRDGDEWVIHGEKTFITGGGEADFAIVIAVTDPDLGSQGGFTAFLVDRDRGWTSHPIETMGPAAPASLTFDDVRVPQDHVLGEVGKGYELAMRWIIKGRYLIPARGIGACERLLQLAIEYANTRETFGRRIGDNQAIQWMIADTEVDLEATRWLVLRAAWGVDQGEKAQHDAAIAKLYGANAVNRVADRVLQIHGGMGYTRELPIERWYREFRLWRIFEGTDEMQRLIISRDLLRGYRKPGAHFG